MVQARKRTADAKAKRRCRYCKALFEPRTNHGGKPQEFCNSNHRKAFWKYGGLPFDKLLTQIRKEVRKIVREEMANTQMIDRGAA